METLSALLAICAGNSPIPGEFLAQRPVTRSFDVFFDLHPNKRLSKQSRGWWFEMPSRPLWRHCNYYPGTSVMRNECNYRHYLSLKNCKLNKVRMFVSSLYTSKSVLISLKCPHSSLKWLSAFHAPRTSWYIYPINITVHWNHAIHRAFRNINETMQISEIW